MSIGRKGGRGLITSIHDGRFNTGQTAANLFDQAMITKRFFSNPGAMERLIEGLRHVHIPNQQEWIHIQAHVETRVRQAEAHGIRSQGDMSIFDEALSALYPSLSKDLGAEILEIIASPRRPRESLYVTPAERQVLAQTPCTWVQVNIEFAIDPAWCEWCLVVNLDTRVLEIYSGRTDKDFMTYNAFNFIGNVYQTVPKLQYLISISDLVNLTDENFIDHYLGGNVIPPPNGVTTTVNGVDQEVTTNWVGSVQDLNQASTLANGHTGHEGPGGTEGLAQAEYLGSAQELGLTENTTRVDGVARVQQPTSTNGLDRLDAIQAYLDAERAEGVQEPTSTDGVARSEELDEPQAILDAHRAEEVQEPTSADELERDIREWLEVNGAEGFQGPGFTDEMAGVEVLDPFAEFTTIGDGNSGAGLVGDDGAVEGAHDLGATTGAHIDPGLYEDVPSELHSALHNTQDPLEGTATNDDHLETTAVNQLGEDNEWATGESFHNHQYGGFDLGSGDLFYGINQGATTGDAGFHETNDENGGFLYQNLHQSFTFPYDGYLNMDREFEPAEDEEL
ncbi:hypothetical protein F5884DRAFT_526413 [Xylogone sp. PMI_703]|nr:hypothetical protein F5884DRAFT_526413 [Xylogone sp. PMI_703]